MSRTVKSFLLLAVTFILCFVVVSLKSSPNSFAASPNPATFKQALLQYKGKNVEIAPADNSGKYKVKLSDIEDDYIITESFSEPTTVTYTPFSTLHSFKKLSDDKIIIYTK